jgi:ABC-2 type transport system permease protein
MGTTFIIAKREFRSNFDSPLAYVVICIGLLLVGYLFFTWNGGFWQADRASLAGFFGLTPWLLLFVASVVSMRLLAEEKRSGTLELLITLPVRDHEVILGKFLGAWGLVLVLVVSTALYPIFMFWMPWDLGPLDRGPVLTGYLGLILYSAAAVSIGLLISSLTESQAVAFFVTAVLLFVLHGIGNLGDQLPAGWPREVVSYISFSTRLLPFTKGLLNTRDIVYFLSITVGCLMASFRVLERRKWA